MTGADLDREWRATEKVSAEVHDELVAIGIATGDMGLIGVAPIRLCRGDLFEPDPDGRVCLISPVCVHTNLIPNRRSQASIAARARLSIWWRGIRNNPSNGGSALGPPNGWAASSLNTLNLSRFQLDGRC